MCDERRSRCRVLLENKCFRCTVNADGILNTIVRYRLGAVGYCEWFLWRRGFGLDLVVGQCRNAFRFTREYASRQIVNVYMLFYFRSCPCSDIFVEVSLVAVLCACRWFLNVLFHSLHVCELVKLHCMRQNAAVAVRQYASTWYSSWYRKWLSWYDKAKKSGLCDITYLSDLGLSHWLQVLVPVLLVVQNLLW